MIKELGFRLRGMMSWVSIVLTGLYILFSSVEGSYRHLFYTSRPVVWLIAGLFLIMLAGRLRCVRLLRHYLRVAMTWCLKMDSLTRRWQLAFMMRLNCY